MKLFVCLFFSIVCLTQIHAQNISIFQYEGDVFTNVSGTTLERDFDCNQELFFEIELEEESVPFSFRIERVIVEEIDESLERYLTIRSADPAEGSAYSKVHLIDENPFVTPDVITLVHNDLSGHAAAGFSVAYQCSGNPTCVDYKYYVINETNERIDSVRVKFCALANLNKEDKPDLLSIYPNPSFENLNVKISSVISGKGRLSLINVAGEVVYHSSHALSETVIDVSNLDAGIYFLKYSIGLKDEQMIKVCVLD